MTRKDIKQAQKFIKSVYLDKIVPYYLLGHIDSLVYYVDRWGINIHHEGMTFEEWAKLPNPYEHIKIPNLPSIKQAHELIHRDETKGTYINDEDMIF